MVLGDHVFVGPHATLLGCTVGRCCYLATNATVLHGARLGAGAVVAVGALAHAGAVLPSEMFVPPMTVAIGDPARVYPTDRPDELAEAVRGVNFAQAAFGVTHDWTDRIARYERIAEVRGVEERGDGRGRCGQGPSVDGDGGRGAAGLSIASVRRPFHNALADPRRSPDVPAQPQFALGNGHRLAGPGAVRR